MLVFERLKEEGETVSIKQKIMYGNGATKNKVSLYQGSRCVQFAAVGVFLGALSTSALAFNLGGLVPDVEQFNESIQGLSNKISESTGGIVRARVRKTNGSSTISGNKDRSNSSNKSNTKSVTGPSIDPEVIADVQRSLKTLGYYDETVDGKFGFATRAAIKNYQRYGGGLARGLKLLDDKDRNLRLIAERQIARDMPKFRDQLKKHVKSRKMMIRGVRLGVNMSDVIPELRPAKLGKKSRKKDYLTKDRYWFAQDSERASETMSVSTNIFNGRIFSVTRELQFKEKTTREGVDRVAQKLVKKYGNPSAKDNYSYRHSYVRWYCWGSCSVDGNSLNHRFVPKDWGMSVRVSKQGVSYWLADSYVYREDEQLAAEHQQQQRKKAGDQLAGDIDDLL